MSLLGNLFKNFVDDRKKSPLSAGGIKKPDNDHNWWDATKNAAGDFANGGLIGVGLGAYNRAHQPKTDLSNLVPSFNHETLHSPQLPSFSGAEVPKVDYKSIFSGALTDAPQQAAPPPFSLDPNIFKGALDNLNAESPKPRTPLPSFSDAPMERQPVQIGTGAGQGLPSFRDLPIPPPPSFPEQTRTLGGLPETDRAFPVAEPKPPMTYGELPTDLIPSFNPAILKGALDNLNAPQTLTTGEKFQQAADNAEAASKLPPLNLSFLESEKTANEIAAIEGKKYGFKKDEAGKTIIGADGKPVYEKDRDKDHDIFDILKSAGLGFAKGGLMGAIGGGIGGAIDLNYD